MIRELTAAQTPAGERHPDGEFPASTINSLVMNTVHGYAESMRRNPGIGEEEPGLPRN